jgi:HD-GYP domain-containing protein (c-di-GMP phosphodiesterase class II)
MTASTRLADLLAGLSLVSDLGFSMPPESAMRRCVVATLLADRLGLGRDQVADVFYTALLQHVGCIGYAHETAVAYGDELAVNAAVTRMDPHRPGDVVTFVRSVSAGRGPIGLARTAFVTAVRGDAFGRGFANATCEVGGETARRLGLGDGVQRGLRDAVESWDGSAGARGLRGDDIALPARIAAVAAVAMLGAETGAAAGAADAVRRRAGSELDPQIAAAFVERAAELLGALAERDPRELVLDVEPPPVRTLAPARLSVAAAAIGDVADLKSPYTSGHAAGVARLAVAGAERLGLAAGERSELEVAALLHDVGRVGISNAVWERPGPLTHAGWEQVRLHPYHTERILARSEILQPAASIAGMHHERLDGSGYHRGARARDITMPARILAAADVLDAMTHDRPHRPARSFGAAAAAIRDEARGGRLDGDAVEAVLGATPARKVDRRGRPAGLSDREVEVLRLVARGLSNREVADRLTVSRRTVEHHVQHIYDKIGVSSRAAAALFAMEHDLLE